MSRDTDNDDTTIPLEFHDVYPLYKEIASLIIQNATNHLDPTLRETVITTYDMKRLAPVVQRYVITVPDEYGKLQDKMADMTHNPISRTLALHRSDNAHYVKKLFTEFTEMIIAQNIIDTDPDVFAQEIRDQLNSATITVSWTA